MNPVIFQVDAFTDKPFKGNHAAVISPIGEIQHNDTLITINGKKTGAFSQKLFDEITGIQYGEKDDKFGWCYSV